VTTFASGSRCASDFIVKKGPEKSEAKISSGGKEVAEIKKEGLGFRLVRYGDAHEWLLSNKVHGEARPFSFSVRDWTRGGSQPLDDEVFVVRDQLFKHGGRLYMLASQPVGKHWDEHMRSKVRYISRLDDLSHLELAELDYQDRNLRDKTKRLRGTPVGEASGLGIEEGGHHVRLDKELEDVGLFVAAISYLIYASA
jgi:hypothetical protein